MHLTRVVAACTKVLVTRAVYWEPAGLIHASEYFFERARRMSLREPPVDLWIRLEAERSRKRSNVRTYGLAPLGLLDLEVAGSSRTIAEAKDLVRSLARYVLAHGPVLADGHTVGRSDDERIRVRRHGSFVNHRESVFRLAF